MFFLASGTVFGAADGAEAVADLRGRGGERVGTVFFSETEAGVRLDIVIFDLAPGEHAFHIHEKAACGAPDFKSAGGHFNPGGVKHGFLAPEGPHAGDLPNIVVGKDGAFRGSVVTRRVTLKEGEGNSLFRGEGTSIVIHADPDDYITDPAGRGGKRIACGRIRRIE
ncbi:MAG: superoxide dismutase family protein [Candidatus Omnitrophica bacterium]|nr:superoxide dismutase family protein [Candidatus Omnitrophota bacterium]